jgi:hypothetical protein
MLHVLPTSFFIIEMPKEYKVKSRNNIFSLFYNFSPYFYFLSLTDSSILNFSQAFSDFVLSKFHTHTKVRSGQLDPNRK